MAVINTRQGGRADKTYSLLETDVYRMVIKKAEIEADQYAEPDEQGNYPDKLVLTWEVYEATDEQDPGVVGLSVWQRMPPWYGTGKRGPSAFKTLVDSLVEQEVIADFDPDNFDTDLLVGVKQRVNVEKYKKTMGPNTGQDGNRIVGKPMPISRRKPAAPLAQGARRRNVPVAVAEGDEDGDLF
jgi:hypothetical protein